MSETLDLEPIKARLEAATPGNWSWEDWDSDRGHETDEQRHLVNDILGDRGIVGDLPAVILVADDPWIWWDNPEDAKLIAHAPTDLAALIAEVERLRGDA